MTVTTAPEQLNLSIAMKQGEWVGVRDKGGRGHGADEGPWGARA